MKQTETFGNWLVEYDLNDGARLSRLCFGDFDLLTPAPEHFKSPSTDYGTFETRPVYGYDDCFPSVESSNYPGTDWVIPDHGELCWLEWEVEHHSDKLVFSVESQMLPVVFKRAMHFKSDKLSWQFEVVNHGDKELAFQHVMHPLMHLNQIREIQFPGFEEIWGEGKEPVSIQDPESLSKFLLDSRESDVHMLYLQKIHKGSVSWRFKHDVKIRMDFPHNLFPTLGIWWNDSGYPNEDGCKRNECAFEPIAGEVSKLPQTSKRGICQYVGPTAKQSWEITWSVL